MSPFPAVCCIANFTKLTLALMAVSETSGEGWTPWSMENKTWRTAANLRTCPLLLLNIPKALFMHVEVNPVHCVIKDQNSKLLRNIAERERGSFNVLKRLRQSHGDEKLLGATVNNFLAYAVTIHKSQDLSSKVFADG